MLKKHRDFFSHGSQETVVGRNESRKTIVSNQTLVLQSITRCGSGSYRCVASNARGKTISNNYYLDVKCEYDNRMFYFLFNILQIKTFTRNIHAIRRNRNLTAGDFEINGLIKNRSCSQ